MENFASNLEEIFITVEVRGSTSCSAHTHTFGGLMLSALFLQHRVCDSRRIMQSVCLEDNSVTVQLKSVH